MRKKWDDNGKMSMKGIPMEVYSMLIQVSWAVSCINLDTDMYHRLLHIMCMHNTSMIELAIVFFFCVSY